MEFQTVKTPKMTITERLYISWMYFGGVLYYFMVFGKGGGHE